MLIDTSGWLSSLDIRDHRHEAAARLYAAARIRLTHSYVIAELVSLANSRKFSREITLNFLSILFDDPTVEIIWVNEVLTKRALELLKSRTDKSWSLVDAVSFVIMNDEGVVESLTTDHHFEQAGFIQLLES